MKCCVRCPLAHRDAHSVYTLITKPQNTLPIREDNRPNVVHRPIVQDRPQLPAVLNRQIQPLHACNNGRTSNQRRISAHFDSAFCTGDAEFTRLRRTHGTTRDKLFGGCPESRVGAPISGKLVQEATRPRRLMHSMQELHFYRSTRANVRLSCTEVQLCRDS